MWPKCLNCNYAKVNSQSNHLDLKVKNHNSYSDCKPLPFRSCLPLSHFWKDWQTYCNLAGTILHDSVHTR